MLNPPDGCKRALGGVVKVVILLAGAGLSGIFHCKRCKSTGVRSFSCMWQFQGCLAAADLSASKHFFLPWSPRRTRWSWPWSGTGKPTWLQKRLRGKKPRTGPGERRACAHQSIHAQTMITFVLPEHALTRASMPKP